MGFAKQRKVMWLCGYVSITNSGGHWWGRGLRLWALGCEGQAMVGVWESGS